MTTIRRHVMGTAPIRWKMARPLTIRQAIARTERYLLRELDARDRADELARLAQLRALVRMVR